MKMKDGISRKMKHGSKSVGICAAVICAVILLNLLMSSLCSELMLFIDNTPEPLYTLDEETEFLLGKTLEAVDAERGEENPVKVDIIFCADPDILIGNDMLRPVYYTALQMENTFPDNIRVSTRDVWENPSSVADFQINAYSTILPGHVIVSSGSEFRVYTKDSFYVTSSADPNTPWGYDGEKTFVKGIMAVTRAESPICALTINHGEPFATEEGRTKYSEFLRVLEGSGYDVIYLNLEKQEIPEDCRLMITFDPKTDFRSNFQSDGVSEIDKLEKFLDQAYSYVVFADADTPKLTNLEEYLEEWGIVFNRYQNGMPYEVLDPESALAPDGKMILAQYEIEGVGGSITKEMREYSMPPKIAFGNSLSIAYSPTYEQKYVMENEEQGTGSYIYGAYNRNMISRNIYDVFRTTDTAFANATVNGAPALDDKGNPIVLTDSPFRLMTMTEQERRVSEGVGYTNATNYSHVCAIGSVDFASNDVLTNKAYGNTDILLLLLRTVGKEVVPVGLDFKELHKAAIDEDYLASSTAVWYTVILAAVPAVAITVTAGVVLGKRKFRSK